MIDFCIFFVTSECNSNCKNCFYKDKLNKTDDLSLEEIKIFSSKMGNFSTLLFSGGEPFLRKDLSDIVEIFINHNKVKLISIPTNGINTETILLTTEKILNRIKSTKVKLSVNPSIDALENLSKILRGRDDAFLSVIETLKELGVLKKRFNNLAIAVNTVVSSDNLSDLANLIELIDGFKYVDFHNIEVIRPKFFNEYSKICFNLISLKKIHFLATRKYINRLRKDISNSRNAIRKLELIFKLSLRIGRLRYAQIIKEHFLSGKANLFRCPAGKDICVIESNGDVKLCELRESIGNLRDNRYNLRRILNSDEAQNIRNKIIKSCCNCTHICFIDEYINLGLRFLKINIIFLVLYHFLKYILIEMRNHLSDLLSTNI
jgi:MoaA/NifB/PqqE/SkfB family radical SAM enzyme